MRSLLALAALSSPGPGISSATAEVVHASIPDQPVEISIDIPGFERDPKSEIPNRTLLAGTMKDGITISVLWEANLPYVSTAETRKPVEGSQGFQAFPVGDKMCSQFRRDLHRVATMSEFYAYLATPDYLFTIHASRTFPTNGPAKDVRRVDLEPVVKSFTVTGEPDREKFLLPPEVYAFRDQAAKATSSQMDWVVAQCAAHADDWAAHYYLGELGDNSHKTDFAERGYKHVCELLGARTDRTPKQAYALVVALDWCAARLADQKKHDAAAGLCRQILDVSKGDAEKDLMK